MAYLFVHFREKRTPDGEQVYFGISQDGFHWQAVNHGQPMLWSYFGDKGVRDMTITKTQEGKYIIMATDLSLAYGMPGRYQGSWQKIKEEGSQHLVKWESRDLLMWSMQEMPIVANSSLGCVWAPDIIYDSKKKDYILHWSSPSAASWYMKMGIYYNRTKDFKRFSRPQLLYEKPDTSVIDSAIYEEDGWYYLFVKSDGNPETLILLKSTEITGPFERVTAFDDCMATLEQGQYEAPTCVRLKDGKWYLFLDYYGGSAPEKQGYVPFVADSLASGIFRRCEEAFSFPYGFKHGTIIGINETEYQRLANYSNQVVVV